MPGSPWRTALRAQSALLPRRTLRLLVELTGHVDVLLAGEPDAGVKLPHHILVLPGLPYVLHQTRVVEVGAVEHDAERLPGGDLTGAERLHHLPRPLAPVAGGESRNGQEQGKEVQGESQGGSPPPVNPHGSRSAAEGVTALGT